MRCQAYVSSPVFKVGQAQPFSAAPGRNLSHASTFVQKTVNSKSLLQTLESVKPIHPLKFQEDQDYDSYLAPYGVKAHASPSL